MEAMGYTVPIVIERRHGREYSYDIYSRLLKDRVIFLTGPIADGIANTVCAQLLFLQGQDSKKPVYIYLNSPGGTVTGGMAILDTMKYITPSIHTFCIGQCASMAAVILAAGDRRFALKHSRVMIHQPWGGAQGTASDIEIQAEEIKRLKSELNQILSEATGKPLKQIIKDTDRDRYFPALEAKEYGLIDEIIEHPPVTQETDDDDDNDDDETEE